MRLVSLLIRLALVLSVGVALPGSLTLESAIVAKAGGRAHVRRPVPLGAAAAGAPRLGRDNARVDPSLRGKYSASALPQSPPVLRAPTALVDVTPASYTAHPLDRQVASSPRGPPALI